MRDDINEAAFLFEEDIRQKRKEKASLHEATKHKRLGKNSVRFASDLMSRGEKIKHRRSGKIMTSNLYDTILSVDEFLALELHDQKNRMQYWRLKYKILEIQKGMGIWNKRYYEILDTLDLPKERGRGMSGEKRKAKVKEVKPIVETPIIEAPAAIIAPAPAPIQEVIVSGMHLIFNGTHSPEELQRQLLKYATLLDGEEDDFYIELKIVQKPKKEAEAV